MCACTSRGRDRGASSRVKIITPQLHGLPCPVLNHEKEKAEADGRASKSFSRTRRVSESTGCCLTLWPCSRRGLCAKSTQHGGTENPLGERGDITQFYHSRHKRVPEHRRAVQPIARSRMCLRKRSHFVYRHTICSLLKLRQARSSNPMDLPPKPRRSTVLRASAPPYNTRHAASHSPAVKPSAGL